MLKYTDIFTGMPLICITEFIVHANNLVFFAMYRELVIQYGLWDQLRVDQGKEWCLMLFIQEHLAHLRTNTSRAPHLQTTSKMASSN